MKISVIRPVLNEKTSLGKVLKAVIEQPKPFEIIVCDDGSEDGSVQTALELTHLVVMARGGRGPQICEGIRHASGEVLLVLHADTIIGCSAFERIRTELRESDVSGGNFRVVFDGDMEFSTWLTKFYQWLRSKGVYYGDSAIFVRRSVFEKIGGIKPLALMEDFDFVRRLERHGGTICIEDPPVVTSSRRFMKRKPWRIVAQWIVIHVMYYLRVSPRYLARHYQSATHSPSAHD
jgi:rSAM/selenodomain-associated transferase 2